MTQPAYVPVQPSDRIRPSERLSQPAAWRPDRPGDLARPVPPEGERFGSPGSDAGYGLKLAHLFTDQLILADGEGAEDAVAGCVACGLKRAARIGRAPVIYDLEWAYSLWGYLGGGPADLVAHRSKLFRGVSHHYWDQREVVDAVRDETFALTPAEVRERLGSWRRLIIS